MFEELDPDHRILPPADAIGAAMRRGRIIRRQRRTVLATGIAMSLALIGGFALSNPLSTGKALNAPAAPVVISSATLPVGVGPDHLDTGTITSLSSTGTGADTIVYHRYHCDAELDAQTLAETGMAACLRPSTSRVENSGGTDAKTTHEAQLAATVAVAGSSQLAVFLNKVDPPDENWFQQPAKDRQVSLAELRRFLETPEGAQALFRLHFDAAARIDQIEEVYQP